MNSLAQLMDQIHQSARAHCAGKKDRRQRKTRQDLSPDGLNLYLKLFSRDQLDKIRLPTIRDAKVWLMPYIYAFVLLEAFVALHGLCLLFTANFIKEARSIASSNREGWGQLAKLPSSSYSFFRGMAISPCRRRQNETEFPAKIAAPYLGTKPKGRDPQLSKSSGCLQIGTFRFRGFMGGSDCYVVRRQEGDQIHPQNDDREAHSSPGFYILPANYFSF